ncbi:MAG: adenosylcobinamide-GDP ribazoletransferase, partial [Pseudomonadota bacterium]
GCAAISHRKIGGQTGDVLGATQQTVEITVLLTCLAVI